MKLLTDRRFAAAVLVVAILASVLGLGGGSLVRARRAALRVFDEGSDPAFAVRMSMDAYLENCAERARTMAEELRLKVDGDAESAATALALAASIGDGEDLSRRYQDYLALCGTVESMYTDFHAKDIDDADVKTFDDAYYNYQGEVSKIGYDEYHVLAERYNASLNGFPAGAVARLLGLEALETFR